MFQIFRNGGELFKRNNSQNFALSSNLSSGRCEMSVVGAKEPLWNRRKMPKGVPFAF
jgi:hypothetical protein